jgi:hypothetical protein
MADRLYLSLWYPNFHFEGLPAAMLGVMRQLTAVGGESRLSASAAYPLAWNEAPLFSRIFVDDPDNEDALPENAVREATELMHPDTAFEFEQRWPLWVPDSSGAAEIGLETIWRKQQTKVTIVGFGPEFDDASFEQNGHVRVDFGIDSPFLLEAVELDEEATRRVQANIEMLLAFTLSVEKNCGISSRLLWTESGESLAQKLIERLQKVH